MSEGIWIGTEFPPEAEGVYQRRNPHGAKMLDFQWDGEYWRLDGEWRNYHQSGEYLLPAGAWAVTKGVRPPLSDDVQVRWGLRGGFQDSVYSLSAGQLAWSFIGRFRLAPALKPKCEHHWRTDTSTCVKCGISAQEVVDQREAAVRPQGGTPQAVCQASPTGCAQAQSASHPFTPYRDRRFGLLVKYAEPRSRTVPKECPVGAMKVWRDR